MDPDAVPVTYLPQPLRGEDALSEVLDKLCQDLTKQFSLADDLPVVEVLVDLRVEWRAAGEKDPRVATSRRRYLSR